ncbi:MAG: polymerase, partial [Pseudomonadota bacterium]
MLHCTTFHELTGEGALRYLVRADDLGTLTRAVLRGASRRLGRSIAQLRELDRDSVLVLPPEEQYLVLSGRSYFRDLAFDQLHRLQLDLETTGLDPEHNRVFLVALRGPDGRCETLESSASTDAAESDLIRRLCEWVRLLDPDVVENHNLHGFDLPFLARRAQLLGVPLWLGRTDFVGFSRRPAARGASFLRSRDLGRASTGGAPRELPDYVRRTRYTLPGRELIDTMDAVRRHDFAARDLPGHGLKAVARHFGLASDERELIPGRDVYRVFC